MPLQKGLKLQYNVQGCVTHTLFDQNNLLILIKIIMSNIPYTVVEENNLKAVKDTDDFGGVNMWRLYVKTVKGHWDDVQWMDVRNIQQFFTETLPVYREQETEINVEQIN